jgi:hypothetical protein
MVRVRVLKQHRYKTRKRAAGEVYDAKPKDAKVLTLWGLVKPEPEPVPVPRRRPKPVVAPEPEPVVEPEKAEEAEPVEPPVSRRRYRRADLEAED